MRQDRLGLGIGISGRAVSKRTIQILFHKKLKSKVVVGGYVAFYGSPFLSTVSIRRNRTPNTVSPWDFPHGKVARLMLKRHYPSRGAFGIDNGASGR
jgi:hypothetical protein